MDEFVVDLNARRTRKQRFVANGEEISGWALRHGFSPALVYGVLSGRTKGMRGEAHRIAVALGLKAESQDSTGSDATSDNSRKES